MPDKSKLPGHSLLSWSKSSYVFDNVCVCVSMSICCICMCIFPYVCAYSHAHVCIVGMLRPKAFFLNCSPLSIAKAQSVVRPRAHPFANPGSHPALGIVFLCLLSPEIIDSHYICPAFTNVISGGSSVLTFPLQALNPWIKLDNFGTCSKMTIISGYHEWQKR